MKTILRFEFDTQLFYPAYAGPRNIILEDPLHIPATGDPVNFVISDFFEDSKVIEAFEAMEEGKLLYAERLQAIYRKGLVEVVVVVYEEAVFKEQFSHLFEKTIY